MFRDPKPPLAFILEQNQLDRTYCYELPFDQQRIYYLATQRTPQWVSTFLKHGPPGPNNVPVKTCGIFGCINGAHYKWGTQGEANRNRAMPNQNGADNPNAKLDELIVAQIRSVNWRGGYYKNHVAEALGISMKTMSKVVRYYCWEDVKPYKNAAEWAARNAKEDEF